MPDEPEIPNRTAELREILWHFVEDLERIRHLRRKPSLDKLLRVVHAVSQLSGAYLRAAEVSDLTARVAALEAALVERAAQNGTRVH
jgi:hypothetical protein